jgi:hypothetical protein
MCISFLQFDKSKFCKCGPTKCKSSSWRNNWNNSAFLCLVDKREGIEASILCNIWKQPCYVAKSRSTSLQKENPKWNVSMCQGTWLTYCSPLLVILMHWEISIENREDLDAPRSNACNHHEMIYSKGITYRLKHNCCFSPINSWFFFLKSHG